MLMAAVAPLAVTQNVIQLDHDDAWYLHRAVCFSRSFYDFSAFGIYTCMRSMLKSPIAGLLLLPAGPLKHDMVELGAAPFVLACLTFGLGICVAWITLRAEVPLLGVAAAAVAIRLCGPIETADAPFLLDGAFALLVAVTLLLPLLEYAAPAAVPREAVVRGFLWGGIGGVGILTKATFVMFGICVAPLILLVSFRRTGASATRHKMAAATAICVVPAAIFVRFGWSYLKAGWQAAYGDVALHCLTRAWRPRYSSSDTVNSAGYAYWLIYGCLLVVALIRGRRDFHRLSLGLASIAIALVYLVMASLKARISNQGIFGPFGWFCPWRQRRA